MNLTDREMNAMLARKCAPIIDMISRAAEISERNHVKPRKILISPNGYLAIRASFGGFLTEDCRDYNEDSVMGMQIIVDHTMKDFSFRILGSNRDEIMHIDNFRPAEKPEIRFEANRLFKAKPFEINLELKPQTNESSPPKSRRKPGFLKAGSKSKRPKVPGKK